MRGSRSDEVSIGKRLEIVNTRLIKFNLCITLQIPLRIFTKPKQKQAESDQTPLKSLLRALSFSRVANAIEQNQCL